MYAQGPHVLRTALFPGPLGVRQPKTEVNPQKRSWRDDVHKRDSGKARGQQTIPVRGGVKPRSVDFLGDTEVITDRINANKA